jgi:CBS domain-containing protein
VRTPVESKNETPPQALRIEPPGLATAVSLAAIMTTRVTTVDRNDTLDIADRAMAMRDIRHLPVMDGGRVVGVVSQRDLFRSALAAAIGLGSQAQTKLLKSLRVKVVMSEPAVTIGAEVTVAEAARVMLERKIGCLPVTREGALVGIVTDSDLLRLLTGRA